ncbi:MAG: HEPN domain-containing protein [Deltaproteobacteria bacterium]|nr:HEPN domain-containing protein [Deltaproteobacteria bacterium]
MITANIRELVKYRIEQAVESLEAAKILHEKQYERPSVNRAYYAMFYAVLALLATRKQETSKHSGAIALFDLEYAKPGILPKEFSKWLHEAFNLRQRSDYSPQFNLTADEVDRILRNASFFLAEVKELLATELA